jgi:hypothetical protein
MAEHPDAARIGTDAFARPVGSQQTQAGALADLQRDTIDGGQVAVALDHGIDAQRDRGSCRGH